MSNPIPGSTTNPLPPGLIGSSGTEGHGPFFTVNLRQDGDGVRLVSFRTTDCVIANATGMVLGVLLGRLPLARIRELCEEDLVAELGSVPPSKMVFLTYALHALRAALAGDGMGVSNPLSSAATVPSNR